MNKGEIRKLNVTQQSRRRVVIGLAWDPAEETGIIGKVKSIIAKKDIHHDLDLECSVFDKDGHYQNACPQKPGKTTTCLRKYTIVATIWMAQRKEMTRKFP